ARAASDISTCQGEQHRGPVSVSLLGFGDGFPALHGVRALLLGFVSRFSACTRVQTVVPDLVEAVRQYVGNEPPKELHRFHGSNATMLRSEDDAQRGEVHDAGVGDRHSVGIATEVSKHALDRLEWSLRVNNPGLSSQFIEPTTYMVPLREHRRPVEYAGLDEMAPSGEHLSAKERSDHLHGE